MASFKSVKHVSMLREIRTGTEIGEAGWPKIMTMERTCIRFCQTGVSAATISMIIMRPKSGHPEYLALFRSRVGRVPTGVPENESSARIGS
jgi:hypothetical protein